MKTENLKAGDRLTYDDGRPGHAGVGATVLEVGERGMVVQFDDRADTTAVRFGDAEWAGLRNDDRRTVSVCGRRATLIAVWNHAVRVLYLEGRSEDFRPFESGPHVEARLRRSDEGGERWRHWRK